MKRLVKYLLCSSVLAFSSVNSYAKTGLGIILGEPTGLSLSHDIGNAELAGGVAWSIGGNSIHLHLDYLFLPLELGSGLGMYVGLGGAVGLGGSSKNGTGSIAAGARVPIGLKYELSGHPFEFFGEVVPGLLLIPGTGFFVQGGIGVRYTF